MYRTAYRTVDVDGLSVFYREAGPRDAPTILLLHGFPSSSRMWQPLLDGLAGLFHLVAPDYPGFGHSDAPSHTEFAYTFDHLAAVVGRFTQALALTRYTLVVQDYGGPVGFRLAIAHPERLEALIVQNAVAHEDGLGPLWKTRREFWADRQAHEAALRENFFSFAATRQRHVGTSPDTENYDPDLWTDEFAFLSRPGQQDIQADLFYDYRTNVASYPDPGTTPDPPMCGLPQAERDDKRKQALNRRRQPLDHAEVTGAVSCRDEEPARQPGEDHGRRRAAVDAEDPRLRRRGPGDKHGPDRCRDDAAHREGEVARRRARGRFRIGGDAESRKPSGP